MNHLFRHLILSAALLLLCSCATPQTVALPRMFWPSPPDQPRFEWVGHYTNDIDLKANDTKSFYSMLVGEEISATLDKPLSVVSDGKGKAYVSDAGIISVLIFDFNKKTISKLGGEALATVLQSVNGLGIDAVGNVYASDGKSRKIYVVTPQNVHTKVLDVSGFSGSIGRIAIDNINGHIVIADIENHKIVVTDLEGKHLFSFGSRGASDGKFNLPTAVAIEKDGGILVADSRNARIQRFTSKGVFVNQFGRRGDGPGDFSMIKGVATDSEGHIYVTDGKEHRFTVFSSKGELLMTIGGAFSQTAGTRVAAAGFSIPQGIYVDQNDKIFVVDQMNKRIQVFQYLNEAYLAKNPLPANVSKGVK